MKKLFLLVVVLLMSLTLVACDEDALPDLNIPELEVPSVPADLVQGISGNVVKIGNTASKTGAFGVVGVPFSAAIGAAVAAHNANPDSKWEVQYVTYDDGTDPAVGLTNVKKLVEEDKVFAIVGHLGTGTVGATLEYILEKHVPMVYAATGINQLYWADSPGNPVMAVQPIYKTDGQIAYARVISEALFGPNKNQRLAEDAKIAVMYTNDDAGKSIAAGIIDEAKAAGRAGHLVINSFEDTTVDTVVRTTLAAEPQAIIIAGNQAPFNTALVALADLDNEIPVFTSYVNTNASSITNRDYGFDIYGSGWLDITTEAGLAGYYEFYAVMDAAGYGPLDSEGQPNPNNYTGNAFAMAGYVAAKVFLQGIERLDPETDDVTFASFIAKMESAPLNVPMGGRIDFSNGARWGIASMNLSQLTRTLSEGEYVLSFVKVREIESLAEINDKRK